MAGLDDEQILEDIFAVAYGIALDQLATEEYIKNACYILTHINPNIIIHKISGDAPKNLLIAPEWNLHKKWIINGIDKFMRENDFYQGMYYS